MTYVIILLKNSCGMKSRSVIIECAGYIFLPVIFAATIYQLDNPMTG